MDKRIFLFALMAVLMIGIVSGASVQTLLVTENFTSGGRDTAVWGSAGGTCVQYGTTAIQCSGFGENIKILEYLPLNFTDFRVVTRMDIHGANPAVSLFGKDNSSDYYKGYAQLNNGQNTLRHLPDNTILATNTTITTTENVTFDYSYIDGNLTMLMHLDDGTYFGGVSALNVSNSNGTISVASAYTDKYYYIDYIQIYGVSIIPNEYCYQGSATSSSDYDGSCNVVYTYNGDYSTDASTNPTYAYDEDFDTYASGTPYYFYANYSHPSGSVLFQNATWKINMGWKEPLASEVNVSLNLSIDQNCLGISPVKLRMDYYDNGGSAHGYNYTCWDYNNQRLISLGQQVTGTSSIRLAEEGIVWNATDSIALDNCTTYSYPLYNFTIRDEESKDWLSPVSNNTLFEVDLNLSYNGLNLNYSSSFSQINPITICSEQDISNFNFLEYLTASHSADNYVSEFYFIDNGTTLSGTKQIDLYPLKTADSTSFLFNYFDEDGLTIDDIIVHVFRKYIGDGLFREVERSKQNAEGDTIVHLVEEDVIYYFKISIENTTIFTSDTYTALCDSVPCTIVLEESGAFHEFSDDWDLIDDGGYSVKKSVLNRNVNLTFATSSSSTFNITIYELNSEGEYSAVSSGQTTGISGEVVVTIPQSSGNTTFFGAIYKDGEFIKSEWIDLEEDAGVYFGTDLAIFIAIILILALGLMAVDNKEMSIVFVILGALVAGIYGLIDWHDSNGLPLLIYLIIDGGIIAFKLSRRSR